jgi:hypothetical protein
MHKHREPAWWILYGLLPLMGGLFVVEARASLPPGWHKCMQIGTILLIYSLVWIWLWVNDLALLRHGQGVQEKDDADTANGVARRPRGPGFTPPQADVYDGKARPTPRRMRRKVMGREIRKCSHSLGRRSSRSCS